MKLARYLREHNQDRRKIKRRQKTLAYTGQNRRILSDRRSGKERRYHDIKKEIFKERRN